VTRRGPRHLPASIITLYDNIINEKLLQLNGSVKTYLFAIAEQDHGIAPGDKKFDLSKEIEHLELADEVDERSCKRKTLKNCTTLPREIGGALPHHARIVLLP